MSKSDEKHQEKLRRQEESRKRRERIDELKRQRDIEMHNLWINWQNRIARAKA